MDADVAVPLGVVTVTVPVVAPVGTLVAMCELSLTENVAAVPLNFTLVVPVKFVPVIVTLVPVGPLVGEKLEIVGAGWFTTKFVDEYVVPCAFLTEICPVVAPAGTVVAMCVSSVTVNVAATP